MGVVAVVQALATTAQNFLNVNHRLVVTVNLVNSFDDFARHYLVAGNDHAEQIDIGALADFVLRPRWCAFQRPVIFHAAGRPVGILVGLAVGQRNDVAPWGRAETGQTDLAEVRQAIREETKLRLVYTDVERRHTERTIKPLAILYYVEVVLLSAWCELRAGFRHFRVERIVSCETTEDRFLGEGRALRAQWRELQDLP